ncbi:high-potential iron-sulfur protein [Phenylobacterium sp. LjRoot225]|uniref:high-potential iron-sulfur protein n=1 Tax=Phenylobacterium sp. LjRoot225 TaxID=3342285 RepID=UPI003ECF91F5
MNRSEFAGATRRGLLRLALAAPLAGYAMAASAADATCVDPDALTSSQKSMRASLGFKLVSEDPKRRCGGCAFYTAAQGACGKCALLNGPVPADGHCDSWAARK